MKINHQRLMQRLMSHHDVIASLVRQCPVHYVNIPFHGNIGDLLIMQGTLVYLRENYIRLMQISGSFNFDHSLVGKHDVIMFHGGGNFGDLYINEQKTFERAVVRFPGKRIIVLPQTIYFKSPRAYAACCDLLARHSDLHIFVRDKRSYDLAQRMSRYVYLAPDMAHQLWKIERITRRPAKGYLGLLRTDAEAISDSGKIRTCSRSVQHGFDWVTDWPVLVGRREMVVFMMSRFLSVLHSNGLNKGLATLASRLWIKWASMFVQDAVKLFSGYEYIITDRLHGHILACLMSIPNTLVDNSYGKNSGYFSQWTGHSDIVKSDFPESGIL